MGCGLIAVLVVLRRRAYVPGLLVNEGSGGLAVGFRIGARFNERHSATIGTHSLDILQVAEANALRAVEFVFFDGRQRSLAMTVVLNVAP